jgi:hypothetical protein
MNETKFAARTSAYVSFKHIAINLMGSRDSTVGIGRPRGRIGVRWGQDFSLLRVVQTDSGVHPTSYPKDTGGIFSGVKSAVA